MTITENEKRIKTGLLYFLEALIKDGEVLCITDDFHVQEFACKNFRHITVETAESLLLSGNAKKYEKEYQKYDFIIFTEGFCNVTDREGCLKILWQRLKQDGKLYLGIENRLGLKYFCGEKDPCTGKLFSGIEGYNAVDRNQVKNPSGLSTVIDRKKTGFSSGLLTKEEAKKLLIEAGFYNCRFYSVLPGLSNAQLVYSEDYLPKERLATRYIPMYDEPEGVFLHEPWIYDQLINNNMFHQMADSYLIECIKSDETELSDIKHVTLSPDRGSENFCMTVIQSDCVKKIYPEAGIEKPNALMSNTKYLRSHGVKIIDGCIQDKAYIMPYVSGESLVLHMQKLMETDIDKFLALFDRYRDIVYASSEKVCSDENGVPVLKRCYIDLIPLNCFWKDNDFVFYDQEFYLEEVSANIILYRAAIVIYDNDITRKTIYPIERIYERYGILGHVKEYAEITLDFLSKIRNMEELKAYNKAHSCSLKQIEKNQESIAELLTKEKNNDMPKQYHKGYVAGVFDLFHIGHLNLLRRAKELCDHLIVGVVTDEGVRRGKKREPFIPFDERIEIIRSCRYVDEAVEIPPEHCTTIDAYEKYHFDIQVSGSDYENDPEWLKMKAYLLKHGADMIFLPYTEQTNSTKIKSLIDKKLM